MDTHQFRTLPGLTPSAHLAPLPVTAHRLAFSQRNGKVCHKPSFSPAKSPLYVPKQRARAGSITQRTLGILPHPHRLAGSSPQLRAGHCPEALGSSAVPVLSTGPPVQYFNYTAWRLSLPLCRTWILFNRPIPLCTPDPKLDTLHGPGEAASNLITSALESAHLGKRRQTHPL